MDRGQLRLSVSLSGDNITGSYRSVFVPEDWKRSEQEKESRWFPIELILGLSMTFSLAYVVVFGTIRWSKNNFNTLLFIKALILFVILGFVELWSDLPMRYFNFKTEQPYFDQVYQTILLGGVLLLISSLLKAIMISASKDMITNSITVKEKTRWKDGILIGFFLLGIYELLNHMLPTLGPKLGNYSPLNARIELWGQVYSELSSYVNVIFISNNLFFRGLVLISILSLYFDMFSLTNK